MSGLRDQMYDTFDSLDTDLATLAAHARVEGGRRRRRRRRLAVAGSSLAILATFGVCAWVAPGLLAAVDSHEFAAATNRPTTESQRTGLAALRSALATVVPDGVTSDPVGMNEYDEGDGAHAKGGVKFTPAADALPALIELDYTDDDGSPLACDGEEFPLTCEVSSLPDGSKVLTYDLETDGRETGEVMATRRVAVRIVNGMSVSLWVSVPVDAKGHLLSQEAVLRMDQLMEVIAQPEWASLAPLP